MAAPGPRQVKRPRLSLSCVVCRARKVRCGREQPECTNCTRMNKKCVYKTMVRDELTGRVRQLSLSPKDRDLAGLNLPHSNELPGRSSNLLWSPPAVATGPTDLGEARIPHMRGERGSVSRLAQSNPRREDGNSINSMSSSSRNMSLSGTDLGQSRTQQHPVHGDLANPTVPSWEEAMQVPSDHDITRPANSGPPNQRASSQNPSEILSPDYLSLRRGARIQYIGKAFWGFVAGRESLSDSFFDENRHALPDLPLPHIAAASLANLLRSLPTKPVCDVLLQAFFIAVWPLAPLVHAPTMQAEYDDFWEWCRNSNTAMPPAKLQDDPTFISLLFAVLLCGASAAPVTIWASASLQTLRKETIVNHLKSAYTTSLSMSQHLEHPTFNTLVSTLLTGPFVDHPREPMRNLVSVSTTVRLAQTMGFHSEWASSALDPVTREMRRRAWWHIIWLDVQSSISTGLPLCCGSDMQEAVSMLACTRDEEIGSVSASSPPSAESSTSGESVAMIYAIGRFETARLESIIVTRLQSAQGLTHEGFRELVTATKQLHHKINALLAKIPTRGIPEKGFIPSRLANASPLTHSSLYKDDASQPTVFAAWTRIMLTLLKSEVVILLQKPFLQPPECGNPHARKSWTSIVQLCLSYLRNYLQLYQAPAFAPYAWSYCTYYGPLQCTFLILIYLRYFRDAPDYQLARYCVDEVIDHFISQYQLPDSSPTDGNQDNPRPQMPVAIQALVDLHGRLDSPPGSDEPPPPPPANLDPSQFRMPASHLTTNANDSRRQSVQTGSVVSSSATAHRQSGHSTTSGTTRPPPLPLPATIIAAPANDLFRTGLDSVPGQDFLASMSDLAAFSSLLTMESEDFLGNADLISCPSELCLPTVTRSGE